ncbi:unnamed protein product [Peniophora sp. CBMAI 1063]|nr:unnamed protein product [Peniophora sp. CBMAI 1063]
MTFQHSSRALLTDPAWAPVEPHSVLRQERAEFVGLLLAWGSWGILFTVAILCVNVLWRNIRRGNTQHRFLLAYVIMITSIATAGLLLTTKYQQIYTIDQRNYPGGPIAYDIKYGANPITTGERICDFMVNWMADGLLTYRVYVIYGREIIVAIPILTFLASFSMSIVELYIVTRPNSSIYQHKSVEHGLIYWSLSVAVNVMVTVLIVTRLLGARRRLTEALGKAARQSGEIYANISAILVESAMLYTVPAIIFLVGYSLGNVLNAAIHALEVIQGIAPLLIILRVANGRAYSTVTKITSFGVTSNGKRSYPMGWDRVPRHSNYQHQW